MRFTILTIAYLFALFAAAMTLFGGWGILAAVGILAFWGSVFRGTVANFLLWLVIAAMVCLVALVLTPALGESRNASTRNQCLNNLKQISIALQNYRHVHGSYPPAYITDATGKRMHSWRVLILPFLEHQTLFKKYDFNEPWDGPNNCKLWDQMPEVYSCPGRERARTFGGPFSDMPQNVASYFAVVGDETAWLGSRGVAESEITDELSDTLLILEYSGSNQPWTAPDDLTLDQAIECLTTSKPQGHVHIFEGFFTIAFQRDYYLAAFADGHGKAVRTSLKPEVARAITTIAGGEEPEDFTGTLSEIPPTYVTVLRYDRMYAAIVFVALTAMPAFFLRRLQTVRSDSNCDDAVEAVN